MRTGAEEAPRTGAKPVFVDDSGRRRAWLRVAGRVAVVLLAVYAALVAIGLTGALTFPVVHLGSGGRRPLHAPDRTALGRSGHSTAPQAVSAPAHPGRGVPPAIQQLAGTVSRRAVAVAASSPATPPSVTTVPAVQHGNSRTLTTTTAAPPTTVAPVSGNTHGQQTRRHGPPTSTPGKGKGP